MVNRLFPRSRNSHFKNWAKCETFAVQMSFICVRIKTYFHINGFALNLALKQRVGATRNWPITCKHPYELDRPIKPASCGPVTYDVKYYPVFWKTTKGKLTSYDLSIN